jgi:predicted nucleic acid-binding protein
MRMNDRAFFDTNVVIYALAQNDPRNAVAERLLLQGGRISVQVLNEFVSVARGKLRLTWPEVTEALAAIRSLCGDPIAIDVEMHEQGVALAQAHGFAIYDALIIAAARRARCDVLYSEDMQAGRRFGAGLRIENPFAS